jgi:hypothetical protein
MGQALVTTHGEGLHYLLKNAAMRSEFREDPFSNELLTILCMPVVSFSKPRDKVMFLMTHSSSKASRTRT